MARTGRCRGRRRRSPWRDCGRPEAFGVSPVEAAFWSADGESVGEVLALALQVAPDLHTTELAGLLAVGAHAQHGLVSPSRVVELARALAEAGGTAVVAGGSEGVRR